MKTFKATVTMTAALLALTCGCSGAAFEVAPATDDTGGDTGAPETDPGLDAAPDTADGGMPDTGSDTAHPTETGVDADAGDTHVAPDTGAADSGSEVGDTGTSPEVGGDTGMTDTGPEVGTTCVPKDVQCTGDQPLACNLAGTWTTNGGKCGYGCSTGVCSCTAPAGRFKDGPAGVTIDTKTGLSWFTDVKDYSGGVLVPLSSDNLTVTCQSLGMRLPTAAELQTLLAQQETDVFCTGGMDIDPGFTTKQGLKPGYYWTSDHPAGHPTNYMLVNLTNGTSVAAGTSGTGYSNYFLCVSP